MIGGFQVGPFQTNFQQVSAAVVVSDVSGGSWHDHVSEKARRHQRQLKAEERKLKKVEKKIILAEKRVVKERTDGVLANLHRLEMRREEIKARIFQLNVEFRFPEFEDDEEDEIEMLLLQ